MFFLYWVYYKAKTQSNSSNTTLNLQINYNPVQNTFQLRYYNHLHSTQSILNLIHCDYSHLFICDKKLLVFKLCVMTQLHKFLVVLIQLHNCLAPILNHNFQKFSS